MPRPHKPVYRHESARLAWRGTQRDDGHARCAEVARSSVGRLGHAFRRAIRTGAVDAGNVRGRAEIQLPGDGAAAAPAPCRRAAPDELVQPHPGYTAGAERYGVHEWRTDRR